MTQHTTLLLAYEGEERPLGARPQAHTFETAGHKDQFERGVIAAGGDYDFCYDTNDVVLPDLSIGPWAGDVDEDSILIVVDHVRTDSSWKALQFISVDGTTTEAIPVSEVGRRPFDATTDWIDCTAFRDGQEIAKFEVEFDELETLQERGKTGAFLLAMAQDRVEDAELLLYRPPTP